MLQRLSFGGFEIPAWPIAVTIGVSLSWTLILRRTRSMGLRPEAVFAWLVLAFPVGALGGRLLAWAVDLVLLGSARADLDRSGMTVLGSVIACAAFSFPFLSRVVRVDPLVALDAIAFSYPLSLFAGRIGCILNGCCPGRVAEGAIAGLAFPFTVALGAFEPGTEVRAVHVGERLATRIVDLPFFLAAYALFALVACELAYRSPRRADARPGFVVALAVTLDGIGRSVLEPLRANAPAYVLSFTSPWQLGALAFALVGVAGLVITRPRPARGDVSPLRAGS